MTQEGQFAVDRDVAYPGLFARSPVALQVKGGNLAEPLASQHGLHHTPRNLMTSDGVWPAIRAVVGKVVVDEIVEAWTRLLRGQCIAPLDRFGLLLGQNLFGHRPGYLAD